MVEPREIAAAIRVEPVRVWSNSIFQATSGVVTRAGALAVDTAQRFALGVASLLGPAIFLAYALAFWSLAASMGWTGSFLYTEGPLSNWLIWLGIAILVHLAASLLRRRTRQ